MLQKLNTNKLNYPKVNEVWWADLSNAIGSQQGGIHPVVIISNDKYNSYSPMANVLPVTSKIEKRSPVHVALKFGEVIGLPKDSVIQIESIWNINKTQLISKIGVITESHVRQVADKFRIQFPMLDLGIKN